jgi:hypothetical protein
MVYKPLNLEIAALVKIFVDLRIMIILAQNANHMLIVIVLLRNQMMEDVQVVFLMNNVTVLVMAVEMELKVLLEQQDLKEILGLEVLLVRGEQLDHQGEELEHKDQLDLKDLQVD